LYDHFSIYTLFQFKAIEKYVLFFTYVILVLTVMLLLDQQQVTWMVASGMAVMESGGSNGTSVYPLHMTMNSLTWVQTRKLVSSLAHF
jgi:hypothetical protein